MIDPITQRATDRRRFEALEAKFRSGKRIERNELTLWQIAQIAALGFFGTLFVLHLIDRIQAGLTLGGF